jgi:hypothetical protein
VIGDAEHTVRALVEIVNADPRRGDGHATPLTKIRFDDIAIACLSDQGLTPDSIPEKGRRVVLRNNANLSTGGAATDVTDDVHPEVAAHAALICNLTQMLLDPDDEKVITVFPAIPAEWERRGVAFDKLAAKGGILVSAEFKTNRVCVTLENCSGADCTRILRVRLPNGTIRLRHPEKGVQVAEGWATLSALKLPAGQKVALAFDP